MKCGGSAANSTVGPVGHRPDCVGGYPGVYDMMGNVWEWNDVCDSTDPASFCRNHGGAFDSPDTALSCEGMRPWTRNSTAADLGIRCCTDL
jgi:formylglycine-generating enzyme required for sulfatase activity